MPVFDFSNSPEKAKVSECTYTVFRTNAPFTSPDQPILILDTKEKAFPHHLWYFHKPIQTDLV